MVIETACVGSAVSDQVRGQPSKRATARCILPSKVVKNRYVMGILRVSTKQGGDDEKNGSVFTEIR